METPFRGGFQACEHISSARDNFSGRIPDRCLDHMVRLHQCPSKWAVTAVHQSRGPADRHLDTGDDATRLARATARDQARGRQYGSTARKAGLLLLYGRSSSDPACSRICGIPVPVRSGLLVLG